MRIKTALITALLCLSLAGVYAQELTEHEKRIVYDAIEQELGLEEQMKPGSENPQLSDVSAKYNISAEQLEQLIAIAKSTPLGLTGKDVAEELRQELGSLPEDLSGPEIPAILKEVAAKYNMRLGEVGLILMRVQEEEN